LRKLHRKFYYRVLCRLEKHIYGNPGVVLAGVSWRTAEFLRSYFNRSDVDVIPNGVDTVAFSTAVRTARRAESRQNLALKDNDFVLLLIGNDWRTKGLPCVLEAMHLCRDLPLHLVVVGQDSARPYRSMAQQLGLANRCRWVSGSSDVAALYAAADIYVSPSLEDAFALPLLEAMACGLPVITSEQTGGSKIITNGEDGFVLTSPRDPIALGSLLRKLYEQAEIRHRVGNKAALTAQRYTWDRTAADTWKFLQSAGQNCKEAYDHEHPAQVKNAQRAESEHREA
jgi:UDP-glucose:(heptosyl)LPS alpha-1,3-glucosyltransferase